jgi:hypothetical protein
MNRQPVAPQKKIPNKIMDMVIQAQPDDILLTIFPVETYYHTSN